MPMPEFVPANAVGYYVLVSPGQFWNSAWLEDDYVTVAKSAIRFVEQNRELLLSASIETMVKTCISAIDPDIRSLPIEHPQRQRLLHLHKVALAVVAYLMDARYFALIYENGECRFERFAATSVKHAQQLIMQRADVQAIEQRNPPTWSPETLH